MKPEDIKLKVNKKGKITLDVKDYSSIWGYIGELEGNIIGLKIQLKNKIENSPQEVSNEGEEKMTYSHALKGGVS